MIVSQSAISTQLDEEVTDAGFLSADAEVLIPVARLTFSGLFNGTKFHKSKVFKSQANVYRT